jgi:VCBS repeat-containing protein
MKKALYLVFIATIVFGLLVPLSLPAAAAGPESMGLPEISKVVNTNHDGRYIVMLNDFVDPLAAVSQIGRDYPLQIGHIYRSAIKGFSGFIPEALLARLQADPRVKLIEPDLIAHTLADSQTLSTGIDRIDVDLNQAAKIDGFDDAMNVDIAIIDTGIDIDHPDLRVVGGRHFYSTWFGLIQYQDDTYDDDNGHGSHCAGIAAAIDNSIGVVGVAPGARLWAVKVLDSSGSGYNSDIIAGIDWVTSHADQIDVANMSLGFTGNSASLRTAIQNSVNAGIIYMVAAGNDAKDVYGADGRLGTSDDSQPAAFPEVAAISAMADSDGSPGGTGSSTGYGPDDSFATFSNYSRSVDASNPVTSPGKAIDLLMPGVDIYSTYKNGGYTTMSGTSMASPHAAGLAALYITSHGRASNAAGVYAIRQALIDSGMPQSDPDYGLASGGDPDPYNENIGWAGQAGTSNALPKAENEAYTTAEDTALTVSAPGVLSNDTDADADPLQAYAVNLPAHGTLNLKTDGSFTYTPVADYNGQDSFIYRAFDGKAYSNTASVTISVTPVNDTPVANAQSVNVTQGQPKAITLTGSDVDGDALTYAIVTPPAKGSLSGTAPNITYTPNPSYTGGDSFTFKANDGTVDSTPATLSITVSATASGDFTLSASPTSRSVLRSGSASYTVSLTFVNAYSSTVSLSATGQPTGATVTFSPSYRTTTGTSTMKVKTNRTTPRGTYTLTITGQGTDGKTHTAQVTLIVR